MTVDVAFSSPQLMGQTGSMDKPPNPKTAANYRAENLRRAFERVAENLFIIYRDLPTAFAERDWETLGYESWDAYCSEELHTDTIKLQAAPRKELTQLLRSAKATVREIAAATGSTHTTAENDLKPAGKNLPRANHASAENIESALAAGEQTIVDAEIVADGNESADAIVTADEFDAGCQINLFKLMAGLSARIMREGTWQPESLAQAKQLRRNIGKIDKLLERYIEANA